MINSLHPKQQNHFLFQIEFYLIVDDFSDALRDVLDLVGGQSPEVDSSGRGQHVDVMLSHQTFALKQKLNFKI
jgi:hypothetical protein